MCGIVGFVGNKCAVPMLLNGLERLEYRGYDSAGIAVMENGKIIAPKYKGRLDILKEKINYGKDFRGNTGIGHTRWATHGEPSDINSHPHLSENSEFAIVHNGIIENYLILKEKLENDGISFKSETDSEVIAHLFERYYNGNMLDAVRRVTDELKGSYALGIISLKEPETLYAVKKDSPLIVGVGNNENYIASDIPALLEYTSDFYLLEDNEIAVLKKDSAVFYNEKYQKITKEIFRVDSDISVVRKDGYEHFMLKEINEQQRAVKDTLNCDINLNPDEFSNIKIAGCGSAYHVGVIGKYIIERLSRIPVDVEIASEFRYKNPIINKDTLVIAISQSGETADTLAALREAKKRNAGTLAIVNVLGSTLAREAENVLYTRAGTEIAVATTKAFSAQLCVMYLIALKLAKLKNKLTAEEYSRLSKELEKLPVKIDEAVSGCGIIKEFVKIIKDIKSAFFIGRDSDYGVCMEGSLKLKEISYIHSEAYPAGELKHGAISLIEEGVVVVAVVTQDSIRDKMISNIKEVKTRGAVVFAIANEGDDIIKELADFVYYIPKCINLFAPSLALIPLQMFAYLMAKEKGCDIDKPRNLAKSVTVE